MNSVQCSRSPRPCGAALVGALGLVSAALVGAGPGCKIEARLPLADAAGSAELGPDAKLARDLSRARDGTSNIDSISMDEDRAVFTNMHFVLEVQTRQHLARVMRALRRLPDVQKISRVRE